MFKDFKVNSKNAYPAYALDVARSGEDTICTILNARIEKLKSDGFYIDFTCVKDEHVRFSESMTNRYTDEKSHSYIPNFKISDHFGVDREYELNGYHHEFVWVNPKGFTFDYIDFNNMGSVFKTHGGLTYANSFWGIYIRNDELKIHDLIQYDLFRDVFWFNRYNMYDSGNDLICYADVYPEYSSLSGYKGGMFFDFQDFINVRKHLILFSKTSTERIIANYEALIKKEVDDSENICKVLKSEIEQPENVLDSTVQRNDGTQC